MLQGEYSWAIRSGIRAAVPQVVALVEQAQRQAENRHQEFLAAQDRRKRQEDRRGIEESTKRSRETLGQVIQQWADRIAVERFLDELSRSITQLPEEHRASMMDRLTRWPARIAGRS